MTFVFSFQKVLDFKENEKELARQDLDEIRQKQQELEEQLDHLEMAKDAVYSQYNEGARRTVWQVLEVQEEIKHVNLQMEQLTQKKLQVHREVEQTKQHLIHKSQEAKMWNQWKDKSKTAYQSQQDRKEQATLDELAVLRYSQR